MQTNIKVAVRVRPYNRREMETNQRSIIKVMDQSTLLFDPDEDEDEFFFQGIKLNHRDITKRVHKKLSMEFDRVFDVDATNRDLFTECTAPLVASVLNGYNCSVFVYGATGAGKTHTMLGSETCPGLTFLTMRDLFEKMCEQQDTRKFDVGVSYLEVYNEQVMNLLTKTGPLKLREDANGVVVSGLLLKPIYNAEELLELLRQGNSNRTQHPTDANAESSRSHAIFQVHIRITDCKTKSKRTVKLSMIDLAGSERASSTKCIGLRFKEGASINRSLLALGNCINNLADGLKHIPYRDSNLTRILKDSLGGNCQTLMVANVSMSSLTYEDTYNTLKYASRAKNIRTTLRQNTFKSNMPKDFYVKKVQDHQVEIEGLKAAKAALEAKLALLQKTANNDNYKIWQKKIEAVYSSVLQSQEYVMVLDSQIKTWNYSIKLIEDADNYRNMLDYKYSMCDENETRFKEAMDSINKEKKRQTEELERWRKKLRDAHRELDKLKNEIKPYEHEEMLQNLVKRKEIELENSKLKIKTNHTSCIYSKLVTNCDMMQKAFSLVLKNYVDQTQEQNSANIKTLNDQLLLLRSKFIDKYKESRANHGKRLKAAASTDEEEDALVAAPKRQRTGFLDLKPDLQWESIESDSDECEIKQEFKMPNRNYNPNETRVLSAVDMNVASTSRQPRQNLIDGMLSDALVSSPDNTNRIKKVILTQQGEQKFMKTMRNEMLSKQNIPSRTKSPRSNLKRGAPIVSSFKRKPANNGTEPAVRINRAASFRCKKPK